MMTLMKVLYCNPPEDIHEYGEPPYPCAEMHLSTAALHLDIKMFSKHFGFQLKSRMIEEKLANPWNHE